MRIPLFTCSLSLAVGLVSAWSGQTTATSEWFVSHNREGEVRRGRECEIVADRRVFAVMSFINATGFDEESSGATMHPARVQVRAQIAKNLSTHPEKLAEWQAMYRHFACTSADYIEWAITLNADYPFQRVGPDSVCFRPETPVKLKNFPAVLNEFWELARLEEVWAAAKPFYDAELAHYDLPRMNEDLDAVWRYVRMPRRDARTMVSVPNLLDRHYNACSIPCGRWFVSIESPGSHNYGLNIHEYLHEIVNPLVQANYEANADHLRPYFELWRRHPKTNGYDTPVAYVQECLVRALDAYVVSSLYPDRSGAKRDEVARSVSDGFVLAGLFHTRLGEFEKSGESFDLFAARLLAETPWPGQSEQHAINDQVWRPFTSAILTRDLETYFEVHSPDLVRAGGRLH